MNDGTVLVVTAHPDDAEILCGGTLAALAREGWRVSLATVTDGALGGIGTNREDTSAIRRREAREAAEYIGASYVCLGGEDGYLFDSAALRREVTCLIRSVEASIVITHYPWDYHADHRATYSLVEAATLVATLPNVPCSRPPLSRTPHLYHCAPFGYRDPLGNPPVGRPFFVDVTAFMDVKLEMLGKHRSQGALMKVQQGTESLVHETREQARRVGGIAGVAFAEAFWHHLGAGFPRDPALQDVLGPLLRSASGETP